MENGCMNYCIPTPPHIADYVTYAIFATYAGTAAYFRGKKIWHKILIFVTVFFVQSIVFILIFAYEFGVAMSAFNGSKEAQNEKTRLSILLYDMRTARSHAKSRDTRKGQGAKETKGRKRMNDETRRTASDIRIKCGIGYLRIESLTVPAETDAHARFRGESVFEGTVLSVKGPFTEGAADNMGAGKPPRSKPPRTTKDSRMRKACTTPSPNGRTCN
jgi:hypothetical protein